MVNHIEVTVAEFQKILGHKNPTEANSIIKFLASKGGASEVGKRSRKDGKGKSATVWRLPHTVTVELFDASALPSTIVVSETESVKEVSVKEIDAEETQTLEV